MPIRLPVFVMLLLGLSSPLSAQVTIDVATISCNQFATYKISHPDRIAIWMDGYFHGKRGDLTVDIQELDENADKLQQYCLKNPDVLLLQAVETLFGSGN